MKLTHIILLSIVAIFLFGLLMPNGLVAAIANNAWSVSFVRHQYQLANDDELTPPPDTHRHAGMLLAHYALHESDVDAAWDAIGDPGKSPDALVLNTYAQVRYLRGDYPEALAAWRSAGNARSLHNAAVELRAAEQWDAASLAGRFAYEIYPEEYVYGYAYRLFEGGQTDQAIAILNQMLEDYPGSLRRSIWYGFLAGFQQKVGNDAAAVEVYRQALAEDPQNAVFWRNLGMLYVENENDLPQAIFCYQNAIAAEPQESVNYFEVAELYQQAGQTEQAVKAIEKAVSLDPDSIKYRLRAASIYEVGGEFEKALESYQSILTINPDHPEALQGLQRLSGSN